MRHRRHVKFVDYISRVSRRKGSKSGKNDRKNWEKNRMVRFYTIVKKIRRFPCQFLYWNRGVEFLRGRSIDLSITTPFLGKIGQIAKNPQN